MSQQRSILIVSGSRADYSLLYWPMRLLQDDPAFKVSIAVTGMHLAPSLGETINHFADDGFDVSVRVPVIGLDDSNAEMARAIGRGVVGFVDVLTAQRPDLVLLLGDRFEVFAVAQAAFVLKIPIAHLCGGDVTNGALDDGFRHAITKFATLHFVTNEDARARVRQLGEDSARVFNVGSTGIDFIRRAKLLDRRQLEVALGHSISERFLLVTFHPVTLDSIPTLQQAKELLAALKIVPSDIGIILTFANADADGTQINRLITEFVQARPNAHCHPSLGPTRFLSLMHLCAAVVGNSSSGLYEAPSFDVPTVNIGRRQNGRLRASSVFDCEPQQAAISAAIDMALSVRLSGTVNPYGDGTAAEKIVAVLKSIDDWEGLLYKTFADLSSAGQ